MDRWIDRWMSVSGMLYDASGSMMTALHVLANIDVQMNTLELPPACGTSLFNSQKH